MNLQETLPRVASRHRRGVLDALPIPLGSTFTLPALAGPGGMPLIGTFPAPGPPAVRAIEAAQRAR
jgi:hypothetical protein